MFQGFYRAIKYAEIQGKFLQERESTWIGPWCAKIDTAVLRHCHVCCQPATTSFSDALDLLPIGIRSSYREVEVPGCYGGHTVLQLAGRNGALVRVVVVISFCNDERSVARSWKAWSVEDH